MERLPRAISCIAIIVVYTLTAHAAGAAGPWVQAEGGVYGNIGYSVIPRYVALHMEDGSEFNLGRPQTDMSLQIYTEYGFSERLTGHLNVMGKRVTAGDELLPNPTIPSTAEAGELVGPGNTRFGARYGFQPGAYAYAAGLDVEAPTGVYDDDTGLRTGLPCWTATPTFAIGRGYDGSYWRSYIGGGLRTHGFSNVLVYGFEVGGFFTESFMAAFTLDGVESAKDGDVTPPRRNLETGLYLDRQEVTSIGPKLRYEFSKQSAVNAAFFGGPLGHFVAVGPAITVSYDQKW